MLPLATTIDTREAPAYPSPLWIIALFIALSEATAGIAAITTDGLTRLIFAVFTVTFPIGVFGAFLWLLIRHPANLYGPWQYPKDLNVEAYASALARQRRTTSDVYRQAASQAVALASDEHGRSTRTEDVATTFDRLVKESSVLVDCSEFRTGDPALIPVAQDTTVAEFLNAVYFEIAPAVRPFTYGESWVLEDQAGHKQTNIGTQWAQSRNQRRDVRQLSDVGIGAGSSMKAVHIM